MSDKIRLCPATLRYLSDRLLEAADGMETAAETFLVRLSRIAAGLADEAAALPTMLSDWVRACESTKLGSFTLGQTKNGLALFFGEDGHEWIVDFHPDLTMAFIEKVDDCAAYVCATPSELTAALDRLAEESSRD